MTSLVPHPEKGLFKIRSSDLDDPGFEQRNHEYHLHLQNLGLPRDSDLLRFFGWDFFHDGSFSVSSISEDMKTLTIEIEGPNIRHRDQPAHYLDPVKFRCEFGGVAHMEMSAIRFDAFNDPLDAREQWVTFMYAEVDTLKEDLHRLGTAFKRRFHSLLIETMPYRRDLVLIFETLRVIPDDPKGFDAIVNDPAYLMPMWGRSQA